jgi:hypothetical protein
MNTPDPLKPGGSSPQTPYSTGTEAGKTATPLSVAQMELAADFEALRERETNLREYEERLRAWQAQLDARGAQAGPTPGTPTPFVQSLSQLPFSSDSLLASSWEKFHRARALLESEQKQMRDERMMMREAELSMKRREAEVTAREEELERRERQLSAPGRAAKDEPIKPSKIERFTKAPFFGTRPPIRPDK